MTNTEINIVSAALTVGVLLAGYGAYRFMMWFAQFMVW